jgi:hypothetical protein
MEPEVLRGARELIERCRPVIFFEVLQMDALMPSQRLLQALGYELRWLETAAFNPQNHKGATENIWGLGETGVLAMPSIDDKRVTNLPKVTGQENEPPRQAFALSLEKS